ncbi:hypothetical protein [Stutzerimonas kirkiae]|uniref:hypothetical protein n=1 Tax=Stutzerimonas kirkiae TaxID=2211392 RepID=UPI0010371BB2|nr:hypothetical protein [Stutzerimonas kirkiae]
MDTGWLVFHPEVSQPGDCAAAGRHLPTTANQSQPCAIPLSGCLDNCRVDELIRTLKSVLLALVVGLRFVLAFMRFIRLRVGCWRGKVDWKWIEQGLKVTRPLAHRHIANMIVFIPTTWLFFLYWPHLVIPLCLSAAFLLIVVRKTAAYARLTPVRYRHHSPAL